ncbi:MAG TPA: hypothetical protein EYP98_07065, partial [Planctomycetes bacterium]|nr:hypothetical protein [Planctomycetota bacterium]
MPAGGNKGGAGKSGGDDAPTEVVHGDAPTQARAREGTKVLPALAVGTVIGGDYRILKVIKAEPT